MWDDGGIKKMREGEEVNGNVWEFLFRNLKYNLRKG